MIRKLILLALAFWILSGVLIGGEGPSPDDAPLTVDEVREGAARLSELRAKRREVELLNNAALQSEQSTQERARLLETERQLAADKLKLVEDRLALSNEKAEYYKSAYEAVLKAGQCGGWGKFRSVVTFGLWGCK